ncbi:MAG TPA: hypothetical protein VK561_16895, partial [Bradyrhizobium sp.]|nr:hypothetical protein [Bradyrhizobium sp.]
ELERAAEKLLRDGETRRLLVQNAGEVLAQHRGATARTAQLIVDLDSEAVAAPEPGLSLPNG